MGLTVWEGFLGGLVAFLVLRFDVLPLYWSRWGPTVRLVPFPSPNFGPSCHRILFLTWLGGGLVSGGSAFWRRKMFLEILGHLLRTLTG